MRKEELKNISNSNLNIFKRVITAILQVSELSVYGFYKKVPIRYGLSLTDFENAINFINKNYILNIKLHNYNISRELDVAKETRPEKKDTLMAYFSYQSTEDVLRPYGVSTEIEVHTNAILTISESELTKLKSILKSIKPLLKSSYVEVEDKTDIYINAGEIYRFVNTDKKFFYINGKKRIKIIEELIKNNLKGSTLMKVTGHLSIQNLSAEISSINKTFKTKLQLEDKLIINSGGYKLNKVIFNIKKL